MEDENIIKPGNYIIIQRQKYTKLHRFVNVDSTVILGKDIIELGNIVNQPYFSTFKMIPKSNENKKSKHKPHFLELCESLRNLKEDILQSRESGVDNRNIYDDGRSQGLSSEEIEKLRETCTSSSEIVERLVENSKTFSSKTEYAQEKYLKKKEKKYFEFIQVKKPSIRLLTEIYYRQEPEKIMGIRVDTLSQLISYSGVCSNGDYLLYESGTNGLLPAIFISALGKKTNAQLVHMHPGNVPQKQAIHALNFDQEHLERCISVNIYSVLRNFYQSDEKCELLKDTCALLKKRKLSTSNVEDEEDHKTKQQKTNENGNIDCISTTNIDADKNQNNEVIPKWKLENDRACALLKQKLDGLTIMAKEHPSNILNALLPFIKPSRPVVIYNMSRELLMELYVELKTTNLVTGLRLVTNWYRTYQILENRTHPDMNMHGNSGFLLYGYTVAK